MNLPQSTLKQSAGSTDQNDYFEFICFWASMWGPALIIAWASYGACQASMLMAERYSGAVAVAAGFITILLTLVLSQNFPYFAGIMRRYRHLFLLILTFGAGYYWNDALTSSSEEQHTQRVAMSECAKLPQCRLAVQKRDVYIAPAR